jgi:hypothetical protein
MSQEGVPQGISRTQLTVFFALLSSVVTPASARIARISVRTKVLRPGERLNITFRTALWIINVGEYYATFGIAVQPVTNEGLGTLLGKGHGPVTHDHSESGLGCGCSKSLKIFRRRLVKRPDISGRAWQNEKHVDSSNEPARKRRDGGAAVGILSDGSKVMLLELGFVRFLCVQGMEGKTHKSEPPLPSMLQH